jgi:hypothetical protein
LNAKPKVMGSHLRWRALAVSALLLLLMLSGREGGAWWQARKLRAMLGKPLTTDETSHALADYRRIEGESFLGLGLDGVKAPLAQALIKAANWTTEVAEPQLAAVSPADWKQADEFLTTAMELGVADDKVTARRLVAKANVLREELAQALEKDDIEKAREPFLTAAHDLEEAARLDAGWYLPRLSLARLCELPPRALGWCTAEKRQEALREAEMLGSTVTPNEKEQLVLGDLQRAQALHESARHLQDNGAAIQKLLEAEKVLTESIEQLSVSTSTKPQDLLLFRQELDAVRDDLRNLGVGATLDLRYVEEH